MVLGSGPIRIGQGVEFDYCSVHCVWALKKAGYETVIVNNNPETVSTDFDTSDRLYFEPLTPEEVQQRPGRWSSRWAWWCSSAARPPSSWPRHVEEAGVPILGTAAEGH